MEPILRIEQQEWGAVIEGDGNLMRKRFPLRDLNYVEDGGRIRADIYDPIQHYGRQVANGIIRKYRRGNL